ALLRIDAFAFTANNVTYAVAGDMMSYWSFFPGPAGWGRVPVWGYSDVLRSNHSELAVGERIFGYFPMSTHLVVQPDQVQPGRFVDATAHRAALPPVYNQYACASRDDSYSAEHEDQEMVLRPLFLTAFLLDDFIADNDAFGALTVVLSSASSKTALSLAYLLHRNRRGLVDVTGLTAAANRDFVEGLGCYDRVLAYDQIGSLPHGPAAFVARRPGGVGRQGRQRRGGQRGTPPAARPAQVQLHRRADALGAAPAARRAARRCAGVLLRPDAAAETHAGLGRRRPAAALPQ